MFLKRLVFTIGLLALGLPFVRAEKTLPDGTPVYLIDASVTGSGVPYECSPIFISDFRSGSEAFASFQALNDYLAGQSKYGTSNTTKVIVQVNPGSYPDAATITVPNLEFRGAQAFCDWTEYHKTFSGSLATGDAISARIGDESKITGVVSIAANDITFNGFHITGAGRIASTAGTKEAPISDIKLLYNWVSESTIASGWSKPVIQFGTRHAANGDGTNADYQELYSEIEISHNYFNLDCGNYPTAIGFYGVGVNDQSKVIKVHDNQFYGGTTAIMMGCAQGNVEITHNRLDGVGINSTDLNSYTIGFYDSGYFNTTKLSIENNEFIKCRGGQSTYALIRVFQRGVTIPHDNMSVNVRYNIFKGKTKTNNDDDAKGENYLLFADINQHARVKFDIADNHCDNRFYKFGSVVLRDGLGQRDVYASTYAMFTLTRHDNDTYQYSNFGGQSMFTDSDGDGMYDDLEDANHTGSDIYGGLDISQHLKNVNLGYGSAMQCFDIDMVKGDIYTSQLGAAGAFRTDYPSYAWDGENDQIVHLTRLYCTKKAETVADGATTEVAKEAGKFEYTTYATYAENKSMRVAKAGEGSQIQLLHNDGALWVMTGADGRSGGISDLYKITDDISGNYIALFTWQDGADLILDPANPVKSSGYTGEVIFVKHPEATGTDDYLDTHAVVDEVNRYICFGSLSKNSDGKLVRTYCFYDLDQFIGKHIAKTYSGELALLKKISLTQGNRETVRDADDIYMDPGFETYSVQNFAICGDYLYILEGNYSDSKTIPDMIFKHNRAHFNWAAYNNSKLLLNTVNWRTGVFFKRERILDGKIGQGVGATTQAEKDKGYTTQGVKLEYTYSDAAKKEITGLASAPVFSTYYSKSRVYSTPSGICLRPNAYGHVDFYLGSSSGEKGGNRQANFYKYYINRYVKGDGTIVGYDLWPYTRQFDEAKNADVYKPWCWQYGNITLTVKGLAAGFGENVNTGTGFYEVVSGPSYNSNLTNQTTFSQTNTKVYGSFVDDGGVTKDYDYNIRKNSKFGVHFEVWDEDHGTGGDKGEIALTLNITKGNTSSDASGLKYKDKTEKIEDGKYNYNVDTYTGTKYRYAYTYGDWIATVTGPGARFLTAEVENHDRFNGDNTNGTGGGFNVKLKYNGYATRHSDGEKTFDNTYLRLTSPGAFDLVIPVSLHTRSITTGVENLTDGNKDYPVEWYNVQGMRMADGVKLAPGVYIRRQGTDIKKVYIQ